MSTFISNFTGVKYQAKPDGLKLKVRELQTGDYVTYNVGGTNVTVVF